jgi:hypothetical protein
MHTSQTSYHRIVFSKVINGSLLLELAEIIGMEPTDNPEVFDLVQSEGESTTIHDALNDLFPERLLRVGCADSFDMTFDELLEEYASLAEAEGVKLISKLFDKARYETYDESMDLDCDELFDLLRVLGSTHFTVDGIYTQWAMSSSSAVFGAHAGGGYITTQYFCVPCDVVPERAETVIRTLAYHTPETMGDYFVNEFINPIMDRLQSPELTEAVIKAFNRFAGYSAISVEQVQRNLDAYVQEISPKK